MGRGDQSACLFVITDPQELLLHTTRSLRDILHPEPPFWIIRSPSAFPQPNPAGPFL